MDPDRLSNSLKTQRVIVLATRIVIEKRPDLHRDSAAPWRHLLAKQAEARVNVFDSVLELAVEVAEFVLQSDEVPPWDVHPGLAL